MYFSKIANLWHFFLNASRFICHQCGASVKVSQLYILVNADVVFQVPCDVHIRVHFAAYGKNSGVPLNIFSSEEEHKMFVLKQQSHISV